MAPGETWSASERVMRRVAELFVAAMAEGYEDGDAAANHGEGHADGERHAQVKRKDRLPPRNDSRRVAPHRRSEVCVLDCVAHVICGVNLVENSDLALADIWNV